MTSALRPSYLAVLAVVLVTTVLWFLRDTLMQSNFVLVYMLVILLVAIQWGTRISFITAALSFFSYNFFIVKPHFTFLISDPRELLDLGIFLIGALLAGRLASDARHHAEKARQGSVFEEADRLKTALLRAVSHDLRTPLTIIKTSVSNLIHLEHLSAEDRRDMLQTIDGEADHLNRMVGNLLDMSRLQAGVMSLNLALNSLEEVAGDIAARVWQVTGQERIGLDFPADMPLVPFDYGLMLQALANLVDNALRYEPAGSRVRLCASTGPQAACMSVVNHGVNIALEERARIMEPFYYGPGGGTGLGLPVARGIIEAHRGSLRVEDTPGGGATFVITLPLNIEDKKHAGENSGRG